MVYLSIINASLVNKSWWHSHYIWTVENANSRGYSHCGIIITYGVKYKPLHDYKTNYDPCIRQGGEVTTKK